MRGILSQHEELYRYDYLYVQTPADADFFCHFHNEYELLFFYNGNADFNIENQVFHLKKNDLLLIKPSQYHKLCLLSNVPYGRHVFTFQRRVLSAEELEILNNASPIYHIEKENLIEHEFENLKYCESLYEERDFEKLKETSLHSMLAHIKYLPKTNESFHQRHGLIDEIIDYINENIEQPLSAQLLSDRFFISKSYVEQLFVRHLKISCKRYINKKKILYAQTLISTGVPAVKAAELCAYENYSTFYRQYKLIIGIPPIQDKSDGTEA
ncbi:MAG: helix-turn-helix transcriptional regulator [Clostridia bacterium]|nr:helix-turn-helix transcriptional regulator [Clostridia bacterium]